MASAVSVRRSTRSTHIPLTHASSQAAAAAASSGKKEKSGESSLARY